MLNYRIILQHSNRYSSDALGV